jgi:hypothetical protein
MKTALGTRRQLWILLAVLVLAAGLLVRWRSAPSGGSSASRVIAVTGKPGAADEDRPAAKGRRAGEKAVNPDEVAFISSSDFNTLHPRPDSPAQRNIFDLRPPTPITPPTPTPAPPPPPAPGSGGFVGPMPPPPPTPTPAPPDIPFKFIGTFGPKDRPVAVLVLGDQILNARAGDVVFDRFILRRVGYESVDVGFVGFAPAETRRMGIAP